LHWQPVPTSGKIAGHGSHRGVGGGTIRFQLVAGGAVRARGYKNLEAWAVVWVDAGAAQPLAEGHALAARRAQVDQAVLANLLRLNHERSMTTATTTASPSSAK
jgi:hypothetical protein